MRNSRVENAKKVKTLHDVPVYTQGSQDMACGWYCALMMQAALDKDFLDTWWGGHSPDSKAPALPYDGRLRWSLGKCADPEHLEEWLKPWVKGWSKVTSDDEAGRVLAEVIQAIDGDRPSVLCLPPSTFHPGGHYVVVKGYIEEEGRTLFLINDPLVGEATVIAEKALFSPLKCDRPGEPGKKWGDDRALISTKKTWLRDKLPQAGAGKTKREEQAGWPRPPRPTPPPWPHPAAWPAALHRFPPPRLHPLPSAAAPTRPG